LEQFIERYTYGSDSKAGKETNSGLIDISMISASPTSSLSPNSDGNRDNLDTAIEKETREIHQSRPTNVDKNEEDSSVTSSMSPPSPNHAEFAQDQAIVDGKENEVDDASPPPSKNERSKRAATLVSKDSPVPKATEDSTDLAETPNPGRRSARLAKNTAATAIDLENTANRTKRPSSSVSDSSKSTRMEMDSEDEELEPPKPKRAKRTKTELTLLERVKATQPGSQASIRACAKLLYTHRHHRALHASEEECKLLEDTVDDEPALKKRIKIGFRAESKAQSHLLQIQAHAARHLEFWKKKYCGPDKSISMQQMADALSDGDTGLIVSKSQLSRYKNLYELLSYKGASGELDMMKLAYISGVGMADLVLIRKQLIAFVDMHWKRFQLKIMDMWIKLSGRFELDENEKELEDASKALLLSRDPHYISANPSESETEYLKGIFKEIYAYYHEEPIPPISPPKARPSKNSSSSNPSPSTPDAAVSAS
jgi:hypothetical protein